MSNKLLEALKNIQCDLKAPKGQRNNFGKYNYRSAEDILEAVKPLLVKNQCVLTISDEIINEGRIYVKATATLKSCETCDFIETTGFAREEETKKGMDSSQITGAASSYARKYALNGLFAIDDTKDSDATNTHGNSVATNEKNEKPVRSFADQKAESKLAMAGVTEYKPKPPLKPERDPFDIPPEEPIPVDDKVEKAFVEASEKHGMVEEVDGKPYIWLNLKPFLNQQGQQLRTQKTCGIDIGIVEDDKPQPVFIPLSQITERWGDSYLISEWIAKEKNLIDEDGKVLV